MRLSRCGTTEQLGRRQNDLEVGVQGQTQWTSKTISSISRSVPASPELCPYHRYVVSRRIQLHRQQSLKQVPSGRSVDLLVSPETPTAALAFPLLTSHLQPPLTPSLPSLLPQPTPPSGLPVTSSAQPPTSNMST